MSGLNADMKSMRMSTAASGASSSGRLSDFIDLTLGDDEDSDESGGVDLDDSGAKEEVDDSSDIIMLDSPPTIFRGHSSNANTHRISRPSAVLPRGIKWPKILIVGSHTSKCLIPRQFITPGTFARRLDVENLDLAFTRPQYEAAWTQAVNECRDKVDLTATFEAYPGLNIEGFQSMLDAQFEEVIRRMENAEIKTRAEKLEDIQKRIRDAPRETREDLEFLKKLERRQSRLLLNPKTKQGLFKAENDTSKTDKRDKAQIASDRRRGSEVMQSEGFRGTTATRDRKDEAQIAYDRRRRGEVMQPDGSWGTASNTIPLAYNRMTKPDTQSYAHSSSTIPAPIKREPMIGPTLISSLDWYSQSEPDISTSQNAHTGNESKVDHAPFTPYQPLRFSGSSDRRARDQTTMDTHHTEGDLYRPHVDSYRPQGDSSRPQPSIYHQPHNYFSPRPTSPAPSDFQKSTHKPTSPPQNPFPLYPSRGPSAMRLPNKPLSSNTNEQPATATQARLPPRSDAQECASRWSSVDEEMGGVDFDVMEERQKLLPEGKDEHDKYYVRRCEDDEEDEE
ncbi:uncharacterized protein RCO7_04697 [Rhynchosporium graminicola]|uniref:Uncharacterized protein n=1 Tax=Rhynchosporium graminicola TaxID=2792576 RepID=A0A1E1JY00_9HELO|nr:uncharacterized protein RCO7_04697 [Rhynchosporium commune]